MKKAKYDHDEYTDGKDCPQAGYTPNTTSSEKGNPGGFTSGGEAKGGGSGPNGDLP